MRTFTTKEFPVLEWAGFKMENMPKLLDLKTHDLWGEEFVESSIDFSALFTLIPYDYFQGNNLEEKMLKGKRLPSFHQPHTNIYLTDRAMKSLHFTDELISSLPSKVLTLPSVSGSLMLPSTTQYFYRFLSIEDTKFLKNLNVISQVPDGSRWFGVSHFSEGKLTGFEAGFILGNKVEVLPDGYYPVVNAKRYYFIFVGVNLAYYFNGHYRNRLIKPGEEGNQTSQDITIID